MVEKVYGPKSYFPSIEKKYGHPIAHWKKILESSGLEKHLEMVSLLKIEYEMDHDHANAIVGDFRQERWFSFASPISGFTATQGAPSPKI